MLYLAKRFEAAVRELVGDGPIKQRLGSAYGHHLEDLAIPDLPEPLRGRFEALHGALHRAPPMGKENSLNTTVRKMSFAEASSYAETIVELYAEVLRNSDRSEPLKVVRNEEPAQRAASGR